MENTTLNKQKFFAQYHRQEILIRNPGNEIYSNKTTNSEYELSGWEKVAVLELTPLHLITDEDAIALGYPTLQSVRTTYFKQLGKSAYESDFLRSKGYAIDFNGLSVEQQISYGWVVLKTKI